MAPKDDGGLLGLKGCRPDTLTDYIHAIDETAKSLRLKAEGLLAPQQGEAEVRLLLHYSRLH